MAQFKVGDVVQLKSGGSKMTVDAVSDRIWCMWFDGTTQKNGNFPPGALKLVEEG